MPLASEVSQFHIGIGFEEGVCPPPPPPPPPPTTTSIGQNMQELIIDSHAADIHQKILVNTVLYV